MPIQTMLWLYNFINLTACKMYHLSLEQYQLAAHGVFRVYRNGKKLKINVTCLHLLTIAPFINVCYKHVSRKKKVAWIFSFYELTERFTTLIFHMYLSWVWKPQTSQFIIHTFNPIFTHMESGQKCLKEWHPVTPQLWWQSNFTFKEQQMFWFWRKNVIKGIKQNLPICKYKKSTICEHENVICRWKNRLFHWLVHF